MGQNPKDEKMLEYSSEKEADHNEVGKQQVLAGTANPTRLTTETRILGLKRKTFFVLLVASFVLVIAGAIGGGVGGTKSMQDGKKTPTSSLAPSATIPSSIKPSITSTPYANTGMAAVQWTDLNGTAHKRVYYQDQNNKIVESAWDNSSTFDAWEVNTISDAVRPSTPIAAAAGYPHASHNFSLVRASFPGLLLSSINLSEGQKCILHVSE